MEESADFTNLVLSSIETTPITKQVAAPSFFNFFTEHKMPTEKELEEWDPEYIEKLEFQTQSDYEAGCIFRDKIIPHAYDWFTGDAVDSEFDKDEVSSDNKADSSDDDEESDEETNDKDGRRKTKKRGKKDDPNAPNPECRQQ